MSIVADDAGSVQEDFNGEVKAPNGLSITIASPSNSVVSFGTEIDNGSGPGNITINVNTANQSIVNSIGAEINLPISGTSGILVVNVNSSIINFSNSSSLHSEQQHLHRQQRRHPGWRPKSAGIRHGIDDPPQQRQHPEVQQHRHRQ